jgi:hypothetical protein
MIKSAKMRLAGHVSRMRKTRAAYKILIWKTEGKGQQARPRHRCEVNIDMHFKEI